MHVELPQAAITWNRLLTGSGQIKTFLESRNQLKEDEDACCEPHVAAADARLETMAWPKPLTRKCQIGTAESIINAQQASSRRARTNLCGSAARAAAAAAKCSISHLHATLCVIMPLPNHDDCSISSCAASYMLSASAGGGRWLQL